MGVVDDVLMDTLNFEVYTPVPHHGCDMVPSAAACMLGCEDSPKSNWRAFK